MNRVVVITGGTNGFGLHAAVNLASSADTIVLLVRTPRRGQVATEAILRSSPKTIVDLIPGDLADPNSVADFTRTVLERYPRISAVMNNAGGVFEPGAQDGHGWSLNGRINLLSGAAVTLGLKSGLSHGSVVIHTSSMGEALGQFDVGDLGNGVLTSANYPQAKRALLMFTLALQRHWASSGIVVRGFHPQIVLPLENTAPWIRAFLRSTVSRDPLTVGASLAALVREPGLAPYATVGPKPARPSRGAQNESDQELVYQWILEQKE